MIVLPVGHEETTVRRLPWVSFGIMGLCALTFMVCGRSASASTDPAEVAAWVDVLMRWGLVPTESHPVSFVTYMFLHAGWYHLIGNLLILYLAGPFIEDVWGRPLFAAVYLVAGVGAALCHVAGSPGATTPMVGASGAVAGVMGAFLVRYGATRIRFFYLVFMVVRGTFATPAWILLPLWFSAQLILAVLDAGSGVAYWAHVGGFAGGTAAALIIRGLRLERRWIEPVLQARIERTVLNNARVEHSLALRADGNPALALARLRDTLDRDLGNPDAARALWSVALEHERAEAVGPLLIRSIARQLREGDVDPALALWAEILERVPGIRAEAPLLLNLGGLLRERERLREARATLRLALAQHDALAPPGFALRLARIAEVLDPELARSALERALASPDLDPASRAAAASLRNRLTPVEIVCPGAPEIAT